jgi:hypothetical protein
LPQAIVGQDIALHAGKRYDEPWAAMIRERFGLEVPRKEDLPMGCVVAVVTLVGCLNDRMVRDLTPGALERFGLREQFQAVLDWYSGPFGFLCTHVHKLENPVPVRGFQGLWALDPASEKAVRAQLGESVATPNAQMDLIPRDPGDEALITRKDLSDLAHDGDLLGIAHERKRCVEIVRARAEHWRSSSNLVASALEHLAEEIERG